MACGQLVRGLDKRFEAESVVPAFRYAPLPVLEQLPEAQAWREMEGGAEAAAAELFAAQRQHTLGLLPEIE